MSRFAVVALLPETIPGQADFVSREFAELTELAALLVEIEERAPGWRVIAVCHVEDLPLLMEPPKPQEAEDGP